MAELDNPYAAPRSNDDEPPPSDELFLISASQGARFVNLLVDSFVIWLGFFGLLWTVGLDFDEGTPALAYYGLTIGYYLFCEGVFGVTVGKLLTRTRVVALNGGRASFAQIFGRTLSRFVPFEAFSFFGKLPTGWHDRWSNTRVIPRDRA